MDARRPSLTYKMHATKLSLPTEIPYNLRMEQLWGLNHFMDYYTITPQSLYCTVICCLSLHFLKFACQLSLHEMIKTCVFN